MARRLRLTLFTVLGLVLASSMAQRSLELCDEADMLTSNTDGSFYYSSDLRSRNDLDELNAWMTRLNDALAAIRYAPGDRPYPPTRDG